MDVIEAYREKRRLWCIGDMDRILNEVKDLENYHATLQDTIDNLELSIRNLRDKIDLTKQCQTTILGHISCLKDYYGEIEQQKYDIEIAMLGGKDEKNIR